MDFRNYNDNILTLTHVTIVTTSVDDLDSSVVKILIPNK